MTKEFRPDVGDKKYSFDDVQGVDEAKAELQEVVAFLKEPEKFETLGAKMPHGMPYTQGGQCLIVHLRPWGAKM